MHTVVFDIETNGIKDFRTLLGLKTIHCIALATNGDEPRIVEIDEALEELRLADRIVGHNIKSFDIPAIQRLHPEWKPEGQVVDTLIMSRMLYPDIQNDDWQTPEFPKKLIGRHSLKAWGVRLGVHKGDFGETQDWEECTPEMLDYCIQDVRVTQKLWDRIEAENPPSHPTILEHDFADIISQQERDGIAFDVEGARKLHSRLLVTKDRIQKELRSLFPPQIVHMKTPEYYEDLTTDERYEKKKDAPVSIRSRLVRGPLRKKTLPFNPGSRDQIAKGLIEKYGWTPKEFTGEGRPKIDEAVLKSLPYTEAQKMIDYLTITKRLGQVAEGKEAWLKLEQDGRIYGRVNPCGAVTSRCTHSKPNVAQVPRVGAPWGADCRKLFTVPESYVMVGVDMSGLELRCLAHYTKPYDNGLYVDAIKNGDIHAANQEAAGLKDRNTAKTFIYALLYGAGDAKIGSIVGGGAAEGRMLKNQFFEKMPALKIIQSGIKHRLESAGYLRAIDGRKLNIRSPHSALNTLLQSAGAIAMKAATCKIHEILRQQRITRLQCIQVAHIHDEIQFQVMEGFGEKIGRISVYSMRTAGKHLGFRCPLDGEYKIGRNWAETH